MSEYCQFVLASFDLTFYFYNADIGKSMFNEMHIVYIVTNLGLRDKIEPMTLS